MCCLKPLPYPEPDRIVRLFQIDANGRRNGNVSEPNFEDWKNGTRSLPRHGGDVVCRGTCGLDGQSAMIGGERAYRASSSTSWACGRSPGRGFVESERRVGGHAGGRRESPVLANAARGRRSPASRCASVDVVHRMVGVMPPGFDYPAASEYWTPRELNPPQTRPHGAQLASHRAPSRADAAAGGAI